MRHFLLRTALATATLVAASSPAFAQVQLGDTAVAVLQTGDVHIVTAGGDFSAAAPFATVAPELAYGLCIRPNGTVLVATIDTVGMTGSVYDVTSGTPVAFATGFSRPSALSCTGGEILLADADRGVVNITNGGDFTNMASYADGVAAVALFRTSAGTLFATHSDLGDPTDTTFGIFDVTPGGDFAMTAPFALSSDGFMGTITEFNGLLLVAEFGLERITNFTGGGDLVNAPAFGTLTDLLGLVPAGGTLYAGADGEVYDASAGGDITATVPHATGLGGLVFGMAFRGCGDGNVDPPEQCDAGGESATCDVDCTTAACGDTVINTTAGEDCDDGFETVDCNNDCTTSICGDGVTNLTAGETCDDGNTDSGDGCDQLCQSEGAGGAGGGAVAVTVGAGGANAASTGAGGDDPQLDGGGCGCTTTPSQQDGWKLLPLLGLGLMARRRRRRG